MTLRLYVIESSDSFYHLQRFSEDQQSPTDTLPTSTVYINVS